MKFRMKRTNTSPKCYLGLPRGAFTLVEMLVAMAVTLLMMAALARAFSFVGARIRDSRADVEMSDELRDITTRLEDELSRCTVNLQPNTGGEDQPGYFLYYEGPVTDVTSSLFRVYDNDDSAAISIVRDDERYGDFDDYIAFTAVADGDNWFTGKVPRFILDQKYADVTAGVTYNPASPTFAADWPGNPWDPIVIRSKYAEIIYFASPEYDPGSLPGMPAYIDVDGDTKLSGTPPLGGIGIENGLPDRLKVHRRVLLIRPDLNLSTGANRGGISFFNGAINSRSFNGVPFMQADNWPIGSTTTTLSGSAVPAQAWLFGMAAIHQQCDLSCAVYWTL